MAKVLKTIDNRTALPATLSGPGPADFELGSLASRAAARALLVSRTTGQFENEMSELGTLTAYELAVSEGHSGLVMVWLVRLARIAQEKAAIFGTSLSTPEEIRHTREVNKVADELAGGRLHEIACSDHAEAKRWRVLAEEKLQRERSNPPTEDAHRNADGSRKSVQRCEDT